jgi:hypothetical protein
MADPRYELLRVGLETAHSRAQEDRVDAEMADVHPTTSNSALMFMAG